MAKDSFKRIDDAGSQVVLLVGHISIFIDDRLYKVITFFTLFANLNVNQVKNT